VAHELDIRQVREMEGRIGGVSSIDLSSDGKTLASGDDAGAVRLWDLATGRKLRALGPARATWGVKSVTCRQTASL
jgi:WD40 repeat protein